METQLLLISDDKPAAIEYNTMYDVFISAFECPHIRNRSHK